ncbi:MAG: MarR family transcriptional regulator, partial [Erysipelotrichia bacterium]|nr:MarR family transcriptional regulator [Erysipelotrichia bacterium]
KLTESQFGILEALLHLGPLTQKQLAEKILKSGGNITLVIENLLKLGLVKKEKHKDDQRCFWISLTTNGDNLVKKLFPNHVKIITERLSVLSTNEQALLASLCRKLGKNEQV